MGNIKRWFYYFFSLFIYTIIVNSIYYLSEKQEHSLHSFTLPRPTVENILDQNLIGLTYEKYSLEKLKNELNSYQNFKKTKTGSAENTAFIDKCNLVILNDIQQVRPFYCDLLLTTENSSDSTTTQNTKEPAPSLRIIMNAIETDSPETLAHFSQESIFKTLERISSKDEVIRISSMVLNTKKCLPSSIPTLFALKNEHHFPSPQFQETAKNLYQQASECKKNSIDDYYSDISRFRLSLYQIWEDNCYEAKQNLTVISKNPESRYQTRSHYWTSWCARAKGNPLYAQVLQNQIYRINPLSFHRITMDRGLTDPHREIFYREDPKVLFRSHKKPTLNKAVRMIELAFALDEKEYVDDLIRYLIKSNSKTEPEFQLYSILLAHKNNQNLLVFKTFSTFFEKYPEMISRSTLKLSYPQKYFDHIIGNTAELDPFLVAALIRQESGFASNARSPVGALGLMQIMPATARTMNRSISNSELLKVETNINLGTKYLKKLIDQSNGSVDLALASYNAGAIRAQEWSKRYPIENRMLFLDLIPYSETRNYISLITRNYYWYLRLYSPESLTEWDNFDRKPAQIYNSTPLFSQTLGIKPQPVIKELDDKH